MSEGSEQDLPDMIRYADRNQTPSHSIAPSRHTAQSISTTETSFCTPLYQSSELSRSSDSIQTQSTYRDASYHTAHGSSIYAPSEIRSWASEVTIPLIHREETEEDLQMSMA